VSDHDPAQPPPELLRKAGAKLSGWMVTVVLGVGVGALVLTCLFTAFTGWQRSNYGPLQLAANDGDVKEIERLLQQGADVNARCAFRNWTALHAAADRGRAEAARVLLERGADVDLKDDDGFTPLHVAGSQPSGKAHPKSSEAGRNAVAVLLLDHGANPNATTHSGNNPLHCAVSSYDGALVKILLERGADAAHRNTQGKTPMDYASIMKDQGVTEAFASVSPATRQSR
jgi:ankyrin repeat protein